MDKEEGINLDVEFTQYLQILRPYLSQLLNEEDVKICNSWIQKLSNCTEGDKNLRNKYIFSLCFQLAKGVLSPPFNNYPPPEDLPICDKFNSDDSYSDAETHFMFLKNNNSEKGLKNKLSSKSICQSKTSEMTVASCKIEMDDDIRDIKTFARDFLSSSNSTIANCLQCPEIVNDLKNYVRSEDNVYLRVNNLVEKLREIKTQNTMLNKQLEMLKEKSETKKSLDLSSPSKSTLQIHCAINTDSFGNDNAELVQYCNCKTLVAELKGKLEQLNESKRIELEELKSKHEKEIIQAKTCIRIEVQSECEKRIQDLKEKYEAKLVEIKKGADNDINQLKISMEAIKLDKENAIAAKNTVIDNFRTELDEIKAQNFILRNKFIRANNNINLESIQEKSFQLERRLYKTEKSKNKRIKAYQMQLSNLHREKNLLNASMHLQLLKQRSELVLDLTEKNQKDLTSTFEKLEEKYKELVANVQAAAIQRTLQDQMSLDAIVKAIYDSGDEHASSRHSQDEYHSEPMRSKHKNKNFPFSPKRCRHYEEMDQNVFDIEDNFVPAFCLDEVKLSELFERVYITRNKTADEQLNSNI